MGQVGLRFFRMAIHNLSMYLVLSINHQDLGVRVLY